MAEEFPVMGFDIGGTKIAICLATSTGKILKSTRVPSKDRRPEEVLPELVKAGKQLLAETGTEGKLRAIGIGSPSPMDFERGIILGPCNMKGWDHVEIRDFLSNAFGVAAYFDNDANGAGAAEWLFGAGRGLNDMIYLTMSTGIGAGIIANGRLMRGHSYYGGEVGHMIIEANGPQCNCGLKGCYEAYCGGLALAQRMQRELKDQPDAAVMRAAGGNVDNINVQALEAAVRAGDAYACGIWDEMIERNAQAMGMLMNIFNPAVIALGTIAVHTGDLFMKPLLERLPKYAWNQMRSACKVVPSALGGSIGELSGIAIALNFMYERGEWELPWKSAK